MAYFTENGHTGNNTRASTPTTILIIRDFRDKVVSNWNEQNLAYGSDEWVGSREWGYLRFLLPAGLL